MNNLWDPQHIVTKEQAAEMLHQQFPQLTIQSIEPFGAGWDNTAYLVNHEIVFRFPRREVALEGILSEIAILPCLESLPLPVPSPTFAGKPSEDFPWPFMGYRLLQGKTACSMHLNESERVRLAKPLAQFLKQLHSIKADDLPKGKLLPDLFKRVDIEHHKNMIFDALDKLDCIDNELKANLYQAAEESISKAGHSKTKCVCHGDMYARHILIDENKNISGIIDWGDLHHGDKAVDLAISHSFLPHSAHAIFRHEYGKIDDAVWNLSRMRAIYSGCMIVTYANDIQDLALMEEGIMALRLIAQLT